MKSLCIDKLYFVLLHLCVFFSIAIAVDAQDKTWRPVTPAELSAKTPLVETGADAEAIFWEERIDDSSSDLDHRHYVRVKIFTERGREKYSKFDIPYTKGIKIKDLAARVTKPDGTSVEITEKDIFDREIVKAGGLKIKAKSFAVPNIEPGVIVEYRYKESIDDGGAVGMRLALQRDIPVQDLSYYYKPYESKEPKSQSYNSTDVKFVKDQNGYWLAKRKNVPAFKDEPRMPPEDSVRPWMLLTGKRYAFTNVSSFSIEYIVKDASSPEKYWGGVSAENSSLVKFMTKSSGDIKKAALAITTGAVTQEEKLKKLYEFCQKEIKNTSFDTTLTDEDRRKLPQVNSLSDVLKRKQGRSQYVDMLFGALTSALEMESRIAFSGNRNKMFFDPRMLNENFIHPAAIAVKVGEDYKFFNPGSQFAPYGILPWYEEDTWAMLIAEKNYLWVKTPLTPYTDTVSKRSGKFKLLEDGTLEGDVSIEKSGQSALSYRLGAYDDSANKREEDLKSEVKARVSTAEVSNIVIENLMESTKPLIQRYRIRVPSYAQKTGKRLFLQPGFFEYGNNPVFSSASRQFDIFFRYPWSENDTVEITLPAGFELDNADAPPSLSDASKIGSLAINIGVDKATGFMKYERKYHFGGGGNVLFLAASYTSLKALFDSFHKADTHTITLKQK